MNDMPYEEEEKQTMDSLLERGNEIKRLRRSETSEMILAELGMELRQKASALNRMHYGD